MQPAACCQSSWTLKLDNVLCCISGGNAALSGAGSLCASLTNVTAGANIL